MSGSPRNLVTCIYMFWKVIIFFRILPYFFMHGYNPALEFIARCRQPKHLLNNYFWRQNIDISQHTKTPSFIWTQIFLNIRVVYGLSACCQVCWLLYDLNDTACRWIIDQRIGKLNSGIFVQIMWTQQNFWLI